MFRRTASQLTILTGITLIVLAVLLGGFQAQFPQLLWNSLTVTLGSLVISLGLGSLAGWLVGWTQMPGRRFWLTLLLVWAATPLIIQVSAWDALWGRLSWLTALGQTPYQRWFEGRMAVIWVHGFANLPWVALLFAIARFWIPGDLERYALSHGSWLQTMFRVSLPRLTAVFLLAALLVSLRTFEQFAVSDVYQVRTWAEIWYLGFSLGEFDSWTGGVVPSWEQLSRILGAPFPNTGTAPSQPEPVLPSAPDMPVLPGLLTPVLLFSGMLLTTVGALSQFLNLRQTAQHYDATRLPVGKAGALSLLSIFVGLPMAVMIANLILRVGVGAEMVDQTPVVRWTFGNALEMMRYSWSDYLEAAGWSYLMGFAAAAVVSLLGLTTSWSVRNRSALANGISLLALALLTIPSPLISLACYRWLNLSSVDPIRDAAALSILSPTVALVWKYAGLVILVWQVILSAEAREREDLLKLSSLSWPKAFFRFALRRYAGILVGLTAFLTLVMAGDLATTFATVPPGMDTFPRRILGDLHAGAGSQVAAACLWQMLAIGGLSIVALRGMSRRAS